MVGRGVEGTAMGAEARVADERVIAESPVPAAQATPAPADFSYPARLESDRPEDSLEKTKPATPAAARSETPAPTPRPATQTLPPVPTPRPPTAAASQPAQAGAGLPRFQPQSAAGFAIQVGAFKDRASADGLVRSLKARGFPAYTVAPAGGSGGLFTVRVGIYRDRADAETVQARLSDDKFKPYIIKQ
jgi:DedD protein